MIAGIDVGQRKIVIVSPQIMKFQYLKEYIGKMIEFKSGNFHQHLRIQKA